jgi:ABC-type multidrug transport system ATPase subunit
VQEVLKFQAQLRLPKNWTKIQREYRVEEVIVMLELDEIRHSLIGDETTRGISGGQRKRVNIGMELVKDPSVLFLDEPTSGLDAAGSMTVLRALKRFATVGKLTIIAVLHQPRYDIFTVSVVLIPAPLSLSFSLSLSFWP